MRKLIFIIAVALTIALIFTPVLFAGATVASQVTLTAANPDQAGYAVDQSVSIVCKIKWTGLTANETVSLDLWNSTTKLETLGSYTIPYNVTGTLTPQGTYQHTYTPTTDLTEKAGSETYTVRLMSGGLQLGSTSLVVLVAQPQVTLSSVWQDSNNDRVVNPNEQVTFTIYTNWAFIQTTESHSLYVDWGSGSPQLLTAISVTAGSGSNTATASHGFDTVGSHTVAFTLKDSTGTVVQTSTCSISVVTPGGGTTTPPPATGNTSVVELVTGNWQIIVIVCCVAVVGFILLQGRGKKSG